MPDSAKLDHRVNAQSSLKQMQPIVATLIVWAQQKKSLLPKLPPEQSSITQEKLGKAVSRGLVDLGNKLPKISLAQLAVERVERLAL